MNWFGRKLHYLEINQKILMRLTGEYIVYKKGGVCLKINPFFDDCRTPISPERMVNFLQALENESSFEIWLDRETISYYFWASNQSDANLIRKQFAGYFPDIEMETVPDGYTFPNLIKNYSVSCAKVKMPNERYYHFETMFLQEPLDSVLQVLSNPRVLDQAMIQVNIKPVKDNLNADIKNAVNKIRNSRHFAGLNPYKVRGFQVEINILMNSGNVIYTYEKIIDLATPFSNFYVSPGNRFSLEFVKSRKILKFLREMEQRTVPSKPFYSRRW